MKVYKSKISVKQTASHRAHATVTATAFPTATASSPSVATTAAGAVFLLLPLLAVVTVLAATVAGGKVTASRRYWEYQHSLYAMMSPYERVRIRHLM